MKLNKFLFATTNRSALRLTQRSILLLPGNLSLDKSGREHEADHSPPSSTDIKNTWSYTSTTPVSLHFVVLS